MSDINNDQKCVKFLFEFYLSEDWVFLGAFVFFHPAITADANTQLILLSLFISRKSIISTAAETQDV